MRKRVTKFRWFKRKGSRKLTVKAKKHLSKKLKEYHKKKKIIEEPPELKFFRYSAFKLWTVKNDENYYPQLEIKAHIFSNLQLNVQDVKVKLNEMIRKTKENYDFNKFFKHEITRRRTAYEAEQISREEFKSIDRTILTVNEEDGIRVGFPKIEFF